MRAMSAALGLKKWGRSQVGNVLKIHPLRSCDPNSGRTNFQPFVDMRDRFGKNKSSKLLRVMLICEVNDCRLINFLSIRLLLDWTTV